MSHEAEHPHILPTSVYVAVWTGLIALTGVTVGAHYVDMRHLAIPAIMVVATVKATLVLLYFMHIRFEKPLFPLMIMVTLITYAIFVVLTFSDYLYR
ncbi:MAG: cytochrome C oxidase subunit IV family protein [Planctomycetia bacterium]|nr:cytochrome C oxidase subunit IV family protein [Planctomycetia bacterium]